MFTIQKYNDRILAMNLSNHELFATPEFYHFAYESDRSLFLRMDREAYFSSIFLDGRIQPAASDAIRFVTAPLAQWRGDHGFAIERKNWIFHIAHCGSTLLSRALDRIGANLVLREPITLRQLGVWRAKLNESELPIWDTKLELALALLGKRYRPQAPVIVKANVPVNFILNQIMVLDPGAPAILLYQPLRQYLLAILRTDAHRQWVIRVTDELSCALSPMVGDVAGLDAVERASALWLAQIRAFDAVLNTFPGARSLSADALFAAPRAVVSAAAKLFNVPLSDFELDAIIGSSLFTHDAKDPDQPFNRRERSMQTLALAMAMDRDLTRAHEWILQKLSVLPLPIKLSRPLVGLSPSLL